MKIFHIASEIAPIAKVGGLADVILGLSKKLKNQQNEVCVIIPKYDNMDISLIEDLEIFQQDLISYYEGEWHYNTVWQGKVENITTFFIEPHHRRFFFYRGCFYGCHDDTERFLYFSKVAVEFISKNNQLPDIIHIHDWQTAAIAPLCREIGFTQTKVIFTIHNIEHQGVCTPQLLGKIGLSEKTYANKNSMLDDKYSSCVNLMKGGITYADQISTVSPTYAKEVLSPLGGRGLEQSLQKSKNKFTGILNGIDYGTWDPKVDHYIASNSLENINSENLEKRISINKETSTPKNKKAFNKKAFNKKALRETLTLKQTHSPIVGCISRLVPQKGIHLIKRAIIRTLELNGQFVLLGSSPIPEINEEFKSLKNEIEKKSSDFSLILDYNEQLAHQIFAGIDMLIVPSLFEPCGLTQLIALKYGTIPIVRNTGGLADTIFDVDYSKKTPQETNGFTFNDPDKQGVDSALDRAIKLWLNNPKKWEDLMQNAMNMDYSWDSSAKSYLSLYKESLKVD